MPGERRMARAAKQNCGTSRGLRTNIRLVSSHGISQRECREDCGRERVKQNLRRFRGRSPLSCLNFLTVGIAVGMLPTLPRFLLVCCDN